jgi:hypothetical protein
MTTWRADPEAITRALGGDWYGTYGCAPGPGHSRKDRSLKISAHPTDPNDVILHSFAGDDYKSIKDDLRRQGLLPEWRPGAREEAPHSRPKSNGHANGVTGKTTAEPKPPAPWAETKARLEHQGYGEIAAYEYRDANGALLAEKVRFERIDPETGEREKQFRWRRRGDGGALVTGGIKKGTSTPPYGLAGLLEHADVTVFVLEGEKDVDNFNNLGLPGVAISIEVGHEEGAAHYLQGRAVFVVPDNDDTGRKRADAVLRPIEPVAESARLLVLPGLPPKGDLTDWLAIEGNTPEKLWRLTEHDAQAEADERLLEGCTFYEDIELPPDDEWLIDDVLPAEGIGLCYGPSGAGKTFGVLELALAIARGVPFVGREVQQGTVVFIALESPRGMLKRIKAYRQETRDNGADFVLVRYKLEIANPESVNGLIPKLWAIQRRTGKAIRLVAFDTLAKALTGQDENAACTASLVTEGMVRIQQATGGFVLATHHTGKDPTRGERGTSAFRAAVDTTMEIARRKDNGEDLRDFWLRKQRDGEDEQLIGTYRLSKRVVGRTAKGKEIVSAIVEWVEGRRARSGPDLSPTQRDIMAALDEVVIAKCIPRTPPGHPDLPAGVQPVDGDDLFTAYHDRTKGSRNEVQTDKKEAAFRAQISKLCNEKKVIGRHNGMYWKIRGMGQ